MLQYMPAGNTLVSSFARETIVQEELGKDNHTDLLTVCYDTPRLICERFGPRSIEVEDMYLQARPRDRRAGHFHPSPVRAGRSRDRSDLGPREQRHVPRTEPYPDGAVQRRAVQAIMNGFLERAVRAGRVGARLPRPTALSEPRADLQIRIRSGRGTDPRGSVRASVPRRIGRAHVDRYAERLFRQRVPAKRCRTASTRKRSGDVATINLMPGWIEQRTGIVSLSGWLFRIRHARSDDASGRIRSGSHRRARRDGQLAGPDYLAHIMRITVPNAATGSNCGRSGLLARNKR